jgi:molybdopterin-containing oxidoreductase family iron-sulfur binding subunit
VAFTARLGLYEDETSARCQWHIPEAHALEAWSDARAWDGTASIVQPLIAPLYGGKSAHDMLIGLSQAPGRTAYDVVRDTWKQSAAAAGALDADQSWRTAVHDGVVKGTAFPLKAVTPGNVFAAIGAPAPAAPGLDLVLRADPTVYDGRFANLGWLQELPKPFTKLTWDNTVQLSPATASRLGLRNEDIVEVLSAGR